MKRTLATLALLTMVAGVGIGGTQLVSAASNISSGSGTLAQKIASKFGLNVSDVQSVIDQNRADQEAQHETNFKNNLAIAVKNGKITQAQADHITSVMNQIDTLRAGKTPDQLDQNTKSQIKTQMQALRQWARTNNVGLRYIRGANMGQGSMGRMMNSSDSSANSGSASSTNSSSNSSN